MKVLTTLLFSLFLASTVQALEILKFLDIIDPPAKKDIDKKPVGEKTKTVEVPEDSTRDEVASMVISSTDVFDDVTDHADGDDRIDRIALGLCIESSSRSWKRQYQRKKHLLHLISSPISIMLIQEN